MESYNYKIKFNFHRQLFLFVLLICVSNIYAQKFISLQGRITDAETGKALSFVNISLKNSTIGTVSNDDGFYLFHIPYERRNDTLWVSSIGYNSYKKPISKISGNKLDILLQPKTYSLSEITAKPQNAFEIVKQAIAKIPKNYPTKPINMDGFYREISFENDTCVEMAEAACEFYYRPYGEIFNMKEAINQLFKKQENHNDYYFTIIGSSLMINPADRVNIVESRSSNLRHKYRFKVVPRGGPTGLTSWDIPKTLIFLNKRQLKKKRFTLTNIASYNNRKVYIISYKGKKNVLWNRMTLYIDIETLAFIKIKITSPNFSMDVRKNWTPALYSKKWRRCKDKEILKNQIIEVNYREHKGLWYLSSVSSDHSFQYVFSKYYKYKHLHDSINYKIHKELLINDIKLDNVKKVSEKDNYANSIYSVLCEYDLNYNPKFWKNYNIIKTTPLQDSLLIQLEMEKPLEEQFGEQFIKNDSMPAPVAMILKQTNPYTGLQDNYYWMQNIDNPAVLSYIESENEYTKNAFLPLKSNIRNLYNEMENRHKADTATIPNKTRVNNYVYYYKSLPNSQYDKLYRKKDNSNKEELILDIEKLSKGILEYNISDFYVSPDNKNIAYIENHGIGYEDNLVVKNISTNKIFCEIENASNITWSANSKSFYYLTWDKTNRLDRLMNYNLVTNKSKNLYYEPDKERGLFVKSFNNKWLILYSTHTTLKHHVFLIDLSKSDNNIQKIITPTASNVQRIKVSNDTLYSLAEKSQNLRLYFLPINKLQTDNWKSLINLPGNIYNSRYLLCKDFIVINSHNEMSFNIMIYNKKGDFIKKISFDDAPYTIKLGESCKQNKFRYVHTSWLSPESLYEVDMNTTTMQQRLINKRKILGYNKKNYKTKLLWAKMNDSIKVPISVIYNKKKSKLNGKSPLYIEAYGCYGGFTEPIFQAGMLSLLDRGFIYAVAHVRGGSALGSNWHQQALKLNKKKTFDDYIGCIEYLIQKKYSSKGKIVAHGGSAGGLTLASVVNKRPYLFNTVILGAPYLDLLTVLTDSTQKFSTEEKSEFGDVSKKEVYDYVRSYSPYNNIKAQNYPNILFHIGLNDNRVKYWHSLKSVAKLRNLKTDNNKLYLKTDLYAGHNGYSGYSSFALYCAFIFDNLGIRY